MITYRAIARFWRSVVIPTQDAANQCWGWKATKNNFGYGRLSFNHKSKRYDWTASRFSWVINRGTIPHGMQVHHTCDNPECTNPAHLWLGTQAENARDMGLKKRSTFGERASTVKLTEEQVLEIRKNCAPYKEVREKYGISQTQYDKIKRGERWKHLIDEGISSRAAGL